MGIPFRVPQWRIIKGGCLLVFNLRRSNVGCGGVRSAISLLDSNDPHSRGLFFIASCF